MTTFCPPFGPENGGGCNVKIAQNDLFVITPSTQKEDCNPRKPPLMSQYNVHSQDEDAVRHT